LRVVLGSASSHPAARIRACGAIVLLAALLHGAGSSRALADEKASLENVLLIEQLVDVATTQQLLRSPACAQGRPIIGSGFPHVAIGVQRHCIVGRETDPLARPFVVSPFTNTLAALAINGTLRLAMRHVAPARLHWMRLGIELYPAVIVQTVSSNFRRLQFAPSVTLSVTRRL
jgi:hypothetical protein